MFKEHSSDCLAGPKKKSYFDLSLTFFIDMYR
jgi:hypothetical protein